METWWNWIVFIGALLAGLTLAVDFAYELSEEQENIIELLDICILSVFADDLFNEHRRFKGSNLAFTRMHRLDILAVLPIFRVIRIAKLARLEKLAKLEEIAEIRKGIEAEETVSKSIHARRLKEEE